MDKGEKPPSKKLTPFPVMVGKGAAHCGSGCTLGDIVAEWLVFIVPAIAVWFGYQSIFADKMFAVWIVDYIFAFAFGIVFQYFTIAPMRGLGLWDGLVAAVKADTLSLTAWQVGMYGFMALAQFAYFRPLHRQADRGEHAGILVHHADRDAVRLRHQLSGELVADQSGHQREDVSGTIETRPRIKPGSGTFRAFMCKLRFGRQQPPTHLPLPSNSMVLPLSGTCTGTLTAAMNLAVREFGRTLPPLVDA